LAVVIYAFYFHKFKNIHDVNNVKWFYLAGEPEILQCGQFFNVFVTLRGCRGLAYTDKAYWQTAQISKAGKEKFTLEEARVLCKQIKRAHTSAHESL
jgi:hypothetical protein